MNLIKLDHLSATRVHGDDAESFLQGQLTADLSGLEEGQARLAACCHLTGNVLAVLLVIRKPGGFFLVAARDLIDGLTNHLSRFVLRSDVQFGESLLPVLGCRDANDEAQGDCASLKRTSLNYCIESSTDLDSDPESLEAWRQEEIRSGLTWLNAETSGQFIPQMLGLERLDALSFQKGCFPGQEVIARVRYLGKLKRRPLVAEMSSDTRLQIGSKIELIGEAGARGAAEVVDMAGASETNTCFLVARVAEGSVLSGFNQDGREIRFSQPAQT